MDDPKLTGKEARQFIEEALEGKHGVEAQREAQRVMMKFTMNPMEDISDEAFTAELKRRGLVPEKSGRN